MKIKRTLIENFIKKYNLSGKIEQVKIIIENNELKTNFVSTEKSLIGSVKIKQFSHEDSEIGILETSQLQKMISILDSEIDFQVVKILNNPIAVKISDANNEINYPLAAIDIKAATPKSLPVFEISVPVIENLIDMFSKSKNALNASNFTVSSKNGQVKFIFGDINNNSNRIEVGTSITFNQDIDLKFDAEYLNEVLNANRKSEKGEINISLKGLLQAKFETEEYKSEYYLIAKK